MDLTHFVDLECFLIPAFVYVPHQSGFTLPFYSKKNSTRMLNDPFFENLKPVIKLLRGFIYSFHTLKEFNIFLGYFSSL